MGFPVGYTEHLLIPNLILHLLSILHHLRSLTSTILTFLNLPSQPHIPSHSPPNTQYPPCISATLLRTILPIIQFSDIPFPTSTHSHIHIPDACSICLNSFQSHNDVRILTNCPHVFHCCCIDRWMDCDRSTCPLCRTSLIPDEMVEDFNRWLSAASGIPDLYDEYASIGAAN